MGLYDNFSHTPRKHISTYKGMPIEGATALAKEGTRQYEKSVSAIATLEAAMSKAQSLGQDTEFLREKLNNVRSGFQEYVKRGDLENANLAVVKSAIDFSNDEDIKNIMSSKAAAQEHMKRLDDLRDKGKIDAWQHKQAMGDVAGYQGIKAGDSIGSHLTDPVIDVDLATTFRDRAKSVRKQYQRSRQKDSLTGKIVDIEREYYDPNEIAAEFDAAMMEPQNMQYIRDMERAIGHEDTQAWINSQKQSAVNAMETARTHTKYTGIDKPEGAGANVAGSYLGYERMPILGKEGFGYTDAGEDVDLDDFSPEKIALSRERAKDSQNGNWWDKTSNAMLNWAQGVPSNEGEVKRAQDAMDGARHFYNKTEEEWKGMTYDEKKPIVQEYLNGPGKRQNHMNILKFDAPQALAMGLNKNKATQAQMSDEMTEEIVRNLGSRAVFDASNNEKITIEDDDIMKRVNARDKDYIVEAVGFADARNELISKHPEYADAVVVNIRKRGSDDPDDMKTVIVSTSAGFQRSKVPIDGIESTRYNYNSTAGNISTSFPIASYPGEYSEKMPFFPGGREFKFDGRRSKDEQTIEMQNPFIGDQPLSPEDIRTILRPFGKKVGYDQPTNTIYGLTEFDISNIIHADYRKK